MIHPPRPLALTTRRHLFAGAGAVLSGCGSRQSAVDTIKIGYQRSGVLLLAKARSQMAAALKPTTLDWVEFPSGPPLLEALSAGAVDFGETGDTPPIFAQAAGSTVRYVAVQPISGEGEGLVVPIASAFRTAHDLRGRRVAFTRGSSSHLLVLKALGAVGLSLLDVDPVFLSPSDAASAFARRSVDAWATWDPYLALAQRDQGARVLVSGSTLPMSDAFYLASQSLVDHAPKNLSRLLNALRQEAIWGEEHRPELIRIVAQGSGLPADIVSTSLRRGVLAVEPMRPEDIARQQASAEIFMSAHVIPKAVTIGDATWTGWRPT